MPPNTALMNLHFPKGSFIARDSPFSHDAVSSTAGNMGRVRTKTVKKVRVRLSREHTMRCGAWVPKETRQNMYTLKKRKKHARRKP